MSLFLSRLMMVFTTDGIQTGMAEIDYSSGVSITTSCKDIEGAMQFISDLLESDIIRERFWGERRARDYSVDENGFVLPYQ